MADKRRKRRAKIERVRRGDEKDELNGETEAKKDILIEFRTRNKSVGQHHEIERKK